MKQKVTFFFQQSACCCRLDVAVLRKWAIIPDDAVLQDWFKFDYCSKMMQDWMETCDSSWVIFRTRHFQFDFNISSITNVRIPWRLITSSDTYHPVNLFSLFHEDSPCLTSTKVYLLRLDVSFLMAHPTAFVSLNPELRRNIMRLVGKRQKYNVLWSQRFCVCMTALVKLSCIIDDEEPKPRSTVIITHTLFER